MRFTWDPVKAAANAKNHGVRFAEAMTVFEDPLYVSYADEAHSITEDRFLTVGMSGAGRLLVYHTENRDEIHLIGAARQRNGSARIMKKANRSNGPTDEMQPEYDSSRMNVVARGKHATPVPPGKTRITIRIDTDILDWFYEQVDRAGGGSYQASINQALREHMNREALEPLLRRVVREELRRQRKAS